jgi:hypothetical protein
MNSRLIPGEEGLDHAADRMSVVRIAGSGFPPDVEDAHAIGEVIDHPDLLVRSGSHRHGLQTHGDGTPVANPVFRDAEDLESTVGRVYRKEGLSIGGKGERPNLS